MIQTVDFISKNFIVYIRCMTYNHADYIKECLDGFALQKTNFKYACVVIDDCSTDGEQNRIKEWLKKECDSSSIQRYDLELVELYVAQHSKNPNCLFAFYLLKQNLNGDKRKEELVAEWRRNCKYEAICEGDDYWTDNNKLHEQVDFLEKHSSYSATSSNALVLRAKSDPMKEFGSPVARDYYDLQEIIEHRRFHTATVVFRTASMTNCPYYKKGRWDTFMWCCLLTQAPIHYEGKVTCVYRKQRQGITEATPRVKWLSITSNWADILTECFVPKYVHRKDVVRSVTRDIIKICFMHHKQFNREDKKKLKSLYCHNFSMWNLGTDLKELLIQSVKLLKK